MYNGAKNTSLITAWNKVVDAFKGDALVHSYAFTSFTQLHPRVKDHHVLADELIAYIKSQSTLKVFVP